MTDRNYYKEYEQMWQVSMVLGIMVTLFLIGMMCAISRYNRLEQKVINKEVIEFEDTRYLCNVFETKQVTWEKIQ